MRPKSLSLPDEPYYPVERLWLFDRHTRATWQQTYGEQAPPWDKNRRIKRWADITHLENGIDPASPVEYSYLDISTGTFRRFTVTAREAATPNLPGKYVWPKYVIEPTPAVVVGPPPTEQSPIRPDILSHRADAEALARELGADEVVEAESFTAGPFRIDWRGETRRQWLIKLAGQHYNAGLLLKMRNANGIGSPGEWIMTAGGPHWISAADDTGEQDARPEVPIPCRQLYAVEAIHRTPFGLLVYRIDMPSPLNPEPGRRGGLTTEQDMLLRDIHTWTARILAAVSARGHDEG